MKKYLVITIFFVACAPQFPGSQIVPAEEFSKAAHDGTLSDYSFRKVSEKKDQAARKMQASKESNSIAQYELPVDQQAKTKFVKDGYVLRRSFGNPRTYNVQTADSVVTMGGGAHSARGQLAGHRSTSSPLNPGVNVAAPYGSRSPYFNEQLAGHPSLWQDNAQGTFLFNDHRAYGPMDIVNIVINDNTQGQKRAQTRANSEFDLVAGITEFFGIETRSWAANNASLDPTALVQASTEKEFNGVGDIQRQAILTAQMSAVIMEVLPNGILRIEGSKIVAINNEEEIMVISGLVRQRDINSNNQVDSNRIANMRIDFYGHGTLSDAQSPGWGAQLFGYIWPF